MSKMLSICCLGFNHAKFIKDNLDSISQIDYPEKEVIILDDGSTDETKKLLDVIKNQYTFPVHVILQPNSGNIGKNFNTAFKKSRGELITYISLDDIFNPEILVEELNLIQQSDDIAFVASSTIVAIDEEENVRDDLINPLALSKIKNPSANDLLELEFTEFGSFYLQGSIIRREIIERINGFDEDMTGDDIILRTKIFIHLLKNQHLKFKIIDKNNVFYRIHSNNIHKNGIRQIKIVTEYLGRYWPDRELPDILFAWMKDLINRYSLEQVGQIAKLNSVAYNLVRSPQIQKYIKSKMKKDNYLFRKYIFRKERNGKKRTFILFNYFNYSYKKR